MGTALKEKTERPEEARLASTVALIAGNGQFPLDFAKKVKEAGSQLVVIAFEGESDPTLKEYASAGFFTLKVGQLSKLLKILKKSKVSQATFAGGISRVRLFRNYLPDFKAIALAARIGSIRDDQLLRAVAGEINALGIEVINAAVFLDKAIPEKGTLTRRELSEAEMHDGLIGWQVAKLIGSVEVGQSVAVYKSLILAVEAVEGTDEMLKRAGSLSGLQLKRLETLKDMAVLVKVCKPQQDRRLDLPSFGPVTVEEMKMAGVSAAIIEAGASLLIDPIQTIALANSYGIAIYAAESDADLQSSTALVRNLNPNE
jgi:DUF1009 family protein